MNLSPFKKALDSLYDRFNHPECVHPDPLEFVCRYTAAPDQEIAGLVASCLAYGRVQIILNHVSEALDPMGTSPADFIIGHTLREFKEIYRDFTHRFTRGDELARLLAAIRTTLLEYGSLKSCFLAWDRPEDPTYQSALAGFATFLRIAMGGSCRSLLPDPEKGSAMKRLHLFLRWMVRRDAVDPGTWTGLSPSRLIIPLDTHLHAFGLCYGLTRRKQANLKTALEITDAFRVLCPEDPTRYDFALAHTGILGKEFSTSL